MRVRRESLARALAELEMRGLARVTRIVCGGTWWNTRIAGERGAYRERLARSGVRLEQDDALEDRDIGVHTDPGDRGGASSGAARLPPDARGES